MSKPQSSSSSKKGKRKRTRQPSPSPKTLNLNSKTPREADLEPVAGPSRERMYSSLENHTFADVLETNMEKKESFSTGDDFIPLGSESEDEPPKKQAREWDLGKRDRDHRDRKDDEHSSRRKSGKKRSWEDAERDDSTNRRAVDLKTRKAPWIVDVKWKRCRNVAQMLHEEVKAFVQYISPTRVEHEVRSMVVQLISRAVSKTFPDADVQPFGSFGTKLYLPQGDIDLVVISDMIASMDKVAALRTLANVVRRTGITEKVTVISKAKVPIIKFVSNYGNFNVDISLNQANGVQAGKMINRFLEEFPPLRAIVLVVKSFLNQRSMNEVYSGGLGSYAIVCLVVSFLQMHPKLRRAEIDPSRNLGVLVLEFFELYGKYFNYGETGISLRHGGSYFNKRQRGWRDYDRSYLLSIEDPGDISNDISKGSFGIRNVRQTFAGAFEIMKTVAYERAQTLTARRDGRYVDLRGRNGGSHDADPGELSMLSHILGVSQKTINHRRIVQEVYEDGELARLLGIDTRNGGELSEGEVEDERHGAKRHRHRNRRREEQTIRDAWAEADRDIISSEQEISDRKQKNGISRKHSRDKKEEEEEEEESRYDVRSSRHPSLGRRISQGGPSRKRVRTEGAKDVRGAPAARDVFVVDEDDDEDDESEAEAETERHVARNNVMDLDTSETDDGLAEIERVYAAADRRREVEEKIGRLSNSERHAYWASKGLTAADEPSSP